MKPFKFWSTGLSLLSLTAILAACDSTKPSNHNPGAPLLRQVANSQIPSLGAAESFAAFGGEAGITNQGTKTTIFGNIGSTGASTLMTGFHTLSAKYTETPLNVGTVTGLIYTDAPQGSPADFALAKAVAADALAASNALAALPGGIDPAAGLLGGLTLAPGIYKSASGAFEITGSDLTLDAQGNADAVWVFQMASSLTVGGPGAPRSIILTNGALAKNIYWQVGSAAIINAAGGGTMAGTIIASAGVVFSTPDNTEITTLDGRALGLFASVTMVNTAINTPGVAKPPVVVVPPVDSPVVRKSVSGTNAAAVNLAAGEGFLNIVNNGLLVTATQIGTGTINITNNGNLLTATNTGSGTMCINSNATGTVTVTNTGKGNVTVIATGSEAITITHTGDEDFTYPISTGIHKR